MVSPKSSFILYYLEYYRQDGHENICEIGIFLRNLSNLDCSLNYLHTAVPGGVLDISLGGEVRRGPSYPDPV